MIHLGMQSMNIVDILELAYFTQIMMGQLRWKLSHNLLQQLEYHENQVAHNHCTEMCVVENVQIMLFKCPLNHCIPLEVERLVPRIFVMLCKGIQSIKDVGILENLQTKIAYVNVDQFWWEPFPYLLQTVVSWSSTDPKSQRWRQLEYLDYLVGVNFLILGPLHSIGILETNS